MPRVIATLDRIPIVPTRYHGRGSFILRRRFRAVGAIRIASGTNDLETFKKLDRMLLTLYDQGRLDLLKALRDHALHPLECWDRYRVGRLSELPPAEVLPQLVPRWEAWQQLATTSDANRRARGTALKVLTPFLSPRPELTELPRALLKARDGRREQPVTFNRTRAAALAFTRDVLGRQHAIYRLISDVPVFTEPERHPQPLTPQLLRKLLVYVGLETPAARMIWTLATTGMGPKEYWDDGFTIEEHAVNIHGVKRRGRLRLAPRLSPSPCKPLMPLRAFRTALKRIDRDLTIRDLGRNTYANLLAQAGVPENRARIYMGHGPRTMTQLYQRPQILHWLAEDGAAIQQLLDLTLPGPLPSSGPR